MDAADLALEAQRVSVSVGVPGAGANSTQAASSCWQRVTLSQFLDKLRLVRDEEGAARRAPRTDFDRPSPEYLVDYAGITNWHMMKHAAIRDFFGPWQTGTLIFFGRHSIESDAHVRGPYHDKDGCITVVYHLAVHSKDRFWREVNHVAATPPYLLWEMYRVDLCDEQRCSKQFDGMVDAITDEQPDPILKSLLQESHRPWKVVLRQPLYQCDGFFPALLRADTSFTCDHLDAIAHELLCTPAAVIQNVFQPDDFEGVGLPGSLYLQHIWNDSMLPLAYPILLDVGRPRSGSLVDLHKYIRHGCQLEHYLAYPENLYMDPFLNPFEVWKTGARALMTRGVGEEEVLEYVLSEWQDPWDMLLGLVQELRWRRRWPILRMFYLQNGGRAHAASGASAIILAELGGFLFRDVSLRSHIVSFL